MNLTQVKVKEKKLSFKLNSTKSKELSLKESLVKVMKIWKKL